MRYIIDSIRDKLRRYRRRNKTGEIRLCRNPSVVKQIRKNKIDGLEEGANDS